MMKRESVRGEMAEQVLSLREKTEAIPDVWRAKRELAASLRSLLDCICATDAGAEDLRESATEIAAIAERFANKPVMSDPPGVAEVALSGMETFHDRSPVLGLSNPIAPPLEFSPDASTQSVTGVGSFGNAYEGAPGCVHGGFVAAAFDELLGMACIFSGNPGMTGSLEVRYRSPTPARSALRFEGRFDRREGRKIYTSGEVYSGDVLCAEADGLFISITEEKFESLNASRRERLARE